MLARSRYKLNSNDKFIPCYKAGRKHWSSAGFTNLNRKQKFIPVAELSDMQLSVSGYRGRAVSRKKAVIRKNRDEFMNYTVRVRVRANIKTISHLKSIS
jgi:hypothetical protein